jgi:hypothetical protein
VTTIDIELKIDEGDFTRWIVGLFKGNPAVDPNLIPAGDERGTSWSMDLQPGPYTFKVECKAKVGTQITVTVKSDTMAQPASFSYKLQGNPPGVIVDYLKDFPFTIAADGGVS